MTQFAAQQADLASLREQGRYRELAERKGIDFSSNDYLGLATSDELAQAAKRALERGVPVGSGGSRLLRGNCEEHEALEADAARFFNRESALFLPCGFSANTVLLESVPQKGDCVFHDELVHASTHEGMRLSRAEHRGVRHNDVQAFEDAIAAWKVDGAKGRAWIAVESLYSMDGDFAPLGELATLADRYDAILVVDEAHATGVFGEGGRGLSHALGRRDNIVVLHTCGKALGCEGALLCGPAIFREHIVNRGRGFIFSTAPSPLIAAIVRDALQIVEAADDRREMLARRMTLAEQLLVPLGAQYSGSPIVPLVLGENDRTMKIAARAQAAGFDVRGIRPPTVPKGTSRLRLVMTLNSSEADLRALATLLEDALA